MTHRPIAFVLCALIAAAGCGQSTERDHARAKQLIDSQILRVGNGAEPEGIDPHIVTGVPEHHILTALFEGLVRMDPKDLSIIPGVAESWVEHDDKVTYTFHLRDNAKWSNGDPVTAHDFIYAWQRMLTPALASEYAYMLFYLENGEAFNRGDLTDFSQVGAKALDDRTLEITLAHPTPYFLDLHIHYSWFPVPKDTIERFGDMADRNSRWTRPGNFVGNGPFTLTRWEPNNVLETRKNPHYWDAERIRLQGVNFYPVPLEQTEERMFRSGQLHITENVPISKVPVYLERNPELIRTDPWVGSYFYRVNTLREPFKDVRVRRALAMAIDREAITTNILHGGEKPAHFFTPPDLRGYTARAEIPFDIEQARQLLADAGYPGGQGFPSVEILYNTSEKHQIVAVAIQQMWKNNLGINVTLTNQDWKVYLASTSNETMDYDIARAGWIGDFMDPLNFLECFLTNNGNNRTGWSNTEYDQLIEKSMYTTDRDERFELFQQAEAILLDEVPLIPIYFYTRPILIAPEVRGYESNLLAYVPYDRLWLEAPPEWDLDS